MKRIFTQSFFILLFLISGFGLFGQDIIIQVNSPASVEGQIDLFGVSVGGWAASLQEDTPITSDIVLANDGSASPSLGCVASPAGAYEDKIVFIRRGVCPFSDKVANAEAAGALAVIIVNNDMTGGIINMSAAEGVSVGIPVFMINFQTGEAILSALESGPVNMTLNFLRPDDIGIRDYFSPLAFNSYSTPQSVFVTDSAWDFAAKVFNVSKQDVQDVNVSVQVLFEEEELFSFTETVNMPARTDTFNFTPSESFVVPESLEVGRYRIVYSITSEGFADEKPENNFVTIEFFINDGSVMQSTPGHNIVSRICFENAAQTVDCTIRKDYGQGVVFQFGAFEDTFEIQSVNIVVGGEDGPENLNGPIEFLWINITGGNYANVITGTAQLNDPTNTLIGYGEYTATPDEHNQEIEIDVFDTSLDPLLITSGGVYAGIVNVPAGVMLGWNNRWLNVTPELNNFLYFFPNLFYYDGVFKRRVIQGALYMKLNLQLSSSVDNQPLPQNSVKLFPNPAQDYTMVELDLPKAMNATITLADISGRVIKTDTYQNVQKHTQRLDIGSLSAGTYIVRIATPEGTSTKKLLVVR